MKLPQKRTHTEVSQAEGDDDDELLLRVPAGSSESLENRKLPLLTGRTLTKMSNKMKHHALKYKFQGSKTLFGDSDQETSEPQKANVGI